ncbi:MAG: 5-(carboxyamino)imidazole ribonucleotide mutase [Acidimicrobiia bacterium]|nr:5-(carboxyamino)imidazole ribonucleotide mutase [Acidimicrobiia bacterium]
MSDVVVGIIMGSKSDLDVMSGAAAVLDRFGVGYEVRIISAHRTPEEMMSYAAGAEGRGLKAIIAGAGGSAHLPGMTASHTSLPVIAVPVKRDHHDHEALWSSIKMPSGIPLAVVPENGADNAALLVVRVLSLGDPALAQQQAAFVESLRAGVLRDDEAVRADWKAMLPST